MIRLFFIALATVTLMSGTSMIEVSIIETAQTSGETPDPHRGSGR